MNVAHRLLILTKTHLSNDSLLPSKGKAKRSRPLGEIALGHSWHLSSQPNSRARAGPLPAQPLIFQGRNPRVKLWPSLFTCPSLSDLHRWKLRDEVSKHVSNVNLVSAFRCLFWEYGAWRSQGFSGPEKTLSCLPEVLHILLPGPPFLLSV